MPEATAKAPKIKFSFSYVHKIWELHPTTCVWIETGKNAFYGWSKCLPGDRYSKAKGRVIAITRALEVYSVPRETRREIWAEYWAQGHRKPR